MVNLSKIFIILFAVSLFNHSCQKVTAQAVFEYRSIYSPDNADQEFRSRYDSHHVDCDWDLWGHAMKKIAAGAPDEVYAQVDGQIHREQFCFSNETLYRLTEAYILDQFGEGTNQYSARICIMPQDNMTACTCKQCVKAGNKTGDATPAVTAMICRLAKRFPRHRFFTSAYNTTASVPAKKLPRNVGVLVSASRFQLRVNLSQSKGYKEIQEQLNAWSKITPNIYVWDYINNFNDYLSPFPCLHVMQSRLLLYRDLGVKGIFLNGSGYDYSAFSDVQSAVLAQLMKNPEIDVNAAIQHYFKEHYPTSSSLLYDYYSTLENRTVDTNHHLPLYSESMDEVVASYLKAEEFTHWRAELDKASKSIEGEERQKLNYLLTALSYTQLRLMEEGCMPTDDELRAEMLLVLQGSKELKNMQVYCETDGSIADYLSKRIKHVE